MDKIIAIKPENQAALDEFMKNNYWRSYYEKAPRTAKIHIEDGFAFSLAPEKEDEMTDEEIRKDAEDRLAALDEEGLEYLAKNAHHPKMREYFGKELARRKAK